MAQVQDKPKKKWSMDFFIVAGVMTGILLPVRLVFVEFVSDSTFGSLGLISAISVLMVVLVKKKKLGKFGDMFERELTRLTTGRKRIIILAWMSILTVYFAFSIYSIDQANTTYFDEKERIKLIIIERFGLNNLGADATNQKLIETLEPEQVAGGVPSYLDAIINNYPAVAITQGILNDLSNGFLLHFHIVFFVEGLEIIGVFVFYMVALRKKDKEVTI